MKNKNLVIHRVKRTLFPKYGKVYKTHAVKVREAGGISTCTRIELRSKKAINNFKIIDATHKKAVRVNGLWRGRGVNRILKAVREELYEIYYNPGENLFISNIENNIACDAIKRLNGDFKLSIVKAIINFDKLSKLASNITNVFFQMRNPIDINQIIISGNNLASSIDFKRFSSNSDIKSMNTDILFNNKKLKFSVSKNGWIHFFKNYPLNIRQDFVIYLKQQGILK